MVDPRDNNVGGCPSPRMGVPVRRSVSLVVYGVVYPAVVVATAWVLAGDVRRFNDYALLAGMLSVAGTLFLVAVRGGTRPFTHDWAGSAPDEPLPPPLRSLVFLVMTAVVAFAAVAVV